VKINAHGRLVPLSKHKATEDKMAWRIILLLGIDLMKQREHNQGKNPVGRATL